MLIKQVFLAILVRSGASGSTELHAPIACTRFDSRTQSFDSELHVRDLILKCEPDAIERHVTSNRMRKRRKAHNDN